MGGCFPCKKSKISKANKKNINVESKASDKNSKQSDFENQHNANKIKDSGKQKVKQNFLEI